MTILVIGYYGFANAGDEAILAAIVEQFRASVPRVHLIVSSGNPEATAEVHAVEAIGWNQVGALQRAVASASLIVIGGGGLFHDYWGADPDLLLTGKHWGITYYAGCAILAALSRKPVVLYAVGAGPLVSPYGIRLTKATCDAAARITVRDEASRDALQAIGVLPEKIEVTADPALLFCPANPSRLPSLIPAGFVLQKPVLGVAARTWKIGVDPRFLEREIGAALDAYLVETGGSVVLFPFQEIAGEHENDRAAAERILAHMRLSSQAAIAQGPLSPHQIYGAFGGCDAILGMRLHALIFAATQGIPSVALSYDPKVDAFQASLRGDAQPPLDVKAVDAREIVRRIQEGLRAPGGAPTRAAHLERLQKLASRTCSLALELLHTELPEPSLSSDTLDLLRRSLASQINLAEHNKIELETYEWRIQAFDREHRALGTRAQESDRRVVQLSGQLSQALQDRADARQRQTWLRDEALRLRAEDRAAIARYGASFDTGLQTQRSQRAWQMMLLIRKAYSLFQRGPKQKFLRWAMGAAVGKWGSLAEYEPRFPDVAAYLPETVQPLLAALPPRNPRPQKDRVDIIILAIIDFDFRFQRPQQIAAEMARRGHRVFWISPSRFLTPSARDLYKEQELRENIREIHMRCPPPDIYMGDLRPDQVSAMTDSLAALCRDWAIGENAVLIQLPFWRRLALRLREQQGSKLFYDCMDDWETFQNMGAFNVAEEKSLVKECDVLIVTGAELEEKYRGQGLQPVLIRNGADYDFFSQAQDTDVLAEIPKPIAGYFGAIADWIDLDLVLEVARARPNYSFVLIGQVFDRDTQSLQALPNVFLLGNKRYGDIPAYLFHFDACLIPFLLNQVTKATDPVKLYEYFSLGKPVVATGMAELKQCGDLIYIGRGADDFALKLDAALEERDAGLRERRIAFARTNTWAARVDRIEAAARAVYPPVSILIVSYNSADFVGPCLESIRRNTAYPAYEIILVDNASTDTTVARLKQYASLDTRLSLFALPQNTGFAAGNNRAAREASGELLVFLNADTMVTPGWLHHLAEHVRRDPSIGQICPVTNFAGNEAKINVAYRDAAGMEDFAVSVHRENRWQRMELSVAPLFCALVPKTVWRQVGELDESFGMGMFEDDDFSQRIRAAGFRVVAAEDCFVHHFGQGSFSKIPGDAYRLLFEKNRKRMEEKWQTGWQPHRTRPGVRPAFEEERFDPATFAGKASSAEDAG